MPASLRDLKRKCCAGMLARLAGLKGKMESKEELKERLDKLHASFMRLKNAYIVQRKCVECPEPTVSAGEQPETQLWAAEPFTLLVAEGRVLDLQHSLSPELDAIFVSKPASEISHLARLYADYETRCCDICGKFFYRSTNETPIVRSEKTDYIAAYHKRCAKDF